MRKLKEKKASEMTIGTLVVVVLAVVLLVVLVVGFTTGWSRLWDKVENWFGGGSNVDSINQACQMACTQNAEFEYCCKVREVRYSDSDKRQQTCRSLGVSCSINCKPSTCPDSVLCARTYEVKTDKCDAGKLEDKSRRLDGNLNVLTSNQKCCPKT